MKKIVEALRAATHRKGLERRVIRYQRARIAQLEYQLELHRDVQDRYGPHRHSPRHVRGISGMTELARREVARSRLERRN